MNADPHPDRADGADGLSEQQRSRRRLLRGGAAAAPVILTFASHPVLAGNGSCTTASAFASINASRPDAVVACTGKYPAWWASSANWSSWPTAKYTRTQLFDTALTPYPGSSGKTLLDMLNLPATSGNDCVAKHIVAALLNATTLRTPGVMTELSVKAMWTAFVNNGYKYQPTSGIWWFADSSTPAAPAPLKGGITEWLQTTMS
jgi:hypothetical protein